MKKYFLMSGLLLLFGSILFGSHQYTKIEERRSKSKSLNEEAGLLSELQVENQRLTSILVDTNILEDFRGETEELMRLRAKVSQLRPYTQTTKSEIEAKINRAKSAQDQAQAALTREADWIVEHANQEQRRSIAGFLTSRVNDYIEEHGRMPDSFETFWEGRFGESRRRQLEMPISYVSLSPEDTARIGVRVEDFELLPVPVEFLVQKEQLDAVAVALIIREKTPRQLPNGNWERYYGIRRKDPPYPTDRKVVELEDGDFEKWEREFTE